MPLSNRVLVFRLQLTSGIVVFVWAVLWLLPPIGRRFFRNVADEGTAQFLFGLAAVFLCGFLAEVAGDRPARHEWWWGVLSSRNA
jgi:Kef-type K+ transport system membrane component KefB